MKTICITFLNNKGEYMSIKKEKIPIVRFRDFSEPWIKNQLSEVAEFSKGRGYSKKDLQSHGTPIILYGRLYTSYESVISNVETYANLEENSVVSEGGEVIIPASGESADDISRASCVIDRGIILGGDLNIVRPHEYLNSLFIAITLSNGSQQRELSKRAQGKSVVHLHNSDLKAVKLFYPSYEEQSAIGSLFRTIDKLLVSYRDNLANYQSLKTTMLAKMFPKAGQTVPEIRLDGFEGEWEIKKLSEIVDIVGGGTPDTNVKEYWDGEINWFSPTEVGNSIYLDTSEKRISELGLQKSSAKILPANRTILFTSRAGIGSVGIITKDSTTNQGFQSLVTKKGVDIYFLFSYSSEITRYALKHSAGSTFLEISGKELGKMDIIIPTYDEQAAIGAYFSNLDNLINSHQEKISQLETLKKKLLQDIFI